MQKTTPLIPFGNYEIFFYVYRKYLVNVYKYMERVKFVVA